MPRRTDTTSELKLLTKALERGDTNQRQFSVRITLATSVTLLRECVEQDRIPAEILKKIIEDHYTNKERGVYVELRRAEREQLDALAEHLGTDRAGAVNHVLQPNLTPTLEQAAEELKRSRELVAKLKPTAVAASE